MKQRPPVIQTVLLWSVVTIAALTVATASFVFIAAPTDLVRDQIVQRVKDRTGRDLAVVGGTALTFFPSMGISLQDVTLSPPPGMAGEPMARIAEMDVQVPLWPLLSGQLEVEQLVLRRPELNLRVDAGGRRNWSFRHRVGEQSGPTRVAGGGTGISASKLDALHSLSLGDVRIEDGTIRYVDERRNREEEITGLDLDIGLESLASPLDARGKFTLRRQTVDLTGQLESLANLLAGSPAQLVLRLSGQPGEATYEGTLSTADSTTLAGALTVKSGSLRGLAALIGSPLPEDEGDGPLTLTGKLDTTPTSVSLTNTNAQVGATSVSGFAVLETRRGTRPRLSADLKLSALDLADWLTPDGAHSEPGKAGPAGTSDGRARQPNGGQPQVRGFVARHGWSDVPFNLARLDLVDADVKLAIDRLTYRDMDAGSTRITATLADRIVDATIDEMNLYGGSGRGAVRLDASSAATPVLEANLQLEDVAALELLQDAAEFDWIAGKGRVSLAIKGQGRSELEIVKTLDGRAEFAFRDGALVGIDIPGIISGLHQGRIPRLARNRSDRTAFSQLSASFAIKDGIAENGDLRLDSSLMHVTGTGTADLPRRTLDYTARPKLLAAASGQGGGQPPGFELPIRITGSWDRPDIAADLDAVLKNPSEAVEAAKDIGKRIKSKDLKEALRGFLNDEDGDSGGGTKQKARDLLRKFLKP